MNVVELDRALEEMYGPKVGRGGALRSKPSEEMRRLIRNFKRMEATRDAAAEAREDKWAWDLLGSEDGFEDRDSTLSKLFCG